MPSDLAAVHVLHSTTLISLLQLFVSSLVVNFHIIALVSTRLVMTSAAFPSQITAVGISKPGDLDAIELLKLPFPTAKPNQTIVKVSHLRSQRI